MKSMITLLSLFFTTAVFAQNFYTLKENEITGSQMDMAQFKGKVVLVVNIASQCGFTPQLDGLESLYKKYKDKNLVVLGVPTNDFGGQTPESDEGVKEFCSKTYQVSFPLLQKKTILGEKKRPLFKFLTENGPKELKGDVKWNFEKFLIGKDGKLVQRYSSRVTPDDKGLVGQIETLLK